MPGTTKSKERVLPTPAVDRKYAAYFLMGMVTAVIMLGMENSDSQLKYMYNAVHSYSSVTLKKNNASNKAEPETITTCEPIAEKGVESSKSSVYPSRTDLVYYVPARGRRDRSGAAIVDMLKAQAYCFSIGVPYGGACGATPHQRKNEEMIEVLGLDPILQYKCPPAEGSTDYTNMTTHQIISREVFFEDAQKYFTDEWLDYIHTQVQPKSKRWIQEQDYQASSTDDTRKEDSNSSATVSPQPIETQISQNQNYTIVAHIRRGDVDPCGHWSFRYLPNSHYAKLIDTYSRRAPNGQTVECIVFSESHSLVENFDDFSTRGCQVVLDGDPVAAWKAMLDANALIMSLSSFSAVPALLNKNGIIAFTPSLIEPLRPDWKWHVHKNSNEGWRHLINLCDELNKQRRR